MMCSLLTSSLHRSASARTLAVSIAKHTGPGVLVDQTGNGIESSCDSVTDTIQM